MTAALTHPLTGERVVLGPQAAPDDPLVIDDHWVAADHATLPHAHPGMQERWEIVAGCARFRIGDAEWTARPGQVVVAPAGVPHHAWNLGGEPVRLRITMTPGLRWAEVVRRVFTASDPAELAGLPREFPGELALARPASRLDAALPGWHFRERHERFVPGADPGAAMAALRALTTEQLPLTRALTRARGLRPGPSRAAGGAWLDGLRALGFVTLADAEDELVLGAVGRFWRLGDGLQPVPDRAAFGSFAQPGFARAAASFRALPASGEAMLVTETRVAATDAAARRAFARYWAVVRAGSGLIRRELLAAAAAG